MRLLGVGTNAHSLRVGLTSFGQAAALLLRHAQIEAAFEMIGSVFDELSAITRGGFVIARMERAGGQSLERRLRKGPQRQELLRILLNGSVIFASHPNGDQVDEALFRLRILRQDVAVN